MKPTSAKRIVSFLALSTALIFSSLFGFGQAAEKSAVLDTCARLFGTTVSQEENLYEVNSLYVLQVKFDSNDALTEVAVFPKYVLEETHPEWAQPTTRVFLTPSERAALLDRLDQIKPRGRLLYSAQSGVITNSTEYHLDEYQHGLMYWNEWHAAKETRSLSMQFFREVKGIIAAKSRGKYGLIQRSPTYHYVVVGACGYFVTANTYTSLKAGRSATFRAAGPIQGWGGFSRECNP